MNREDLNWGCKDCGSNTNTIDEYYMVKNSVWLEAHHHPPVDGFNEYWGKHNDPRLKLSGLLCIGCLEKRLERKLNQDDFADVPLNYMDPQSPRLKNRLARKQFI